MVHFLGQNTKILLTCKNVQFYICIWSENNAVLLLLCPGNCDTANMTNLLHLCGLMLFSLPFPIRFGQKISGNHQLCGQSKLIFLILPIFLHRDESNPDIVCIYGQKNLLGAEVRKILRALWAPVVYFESDWFSFFSLPSVIFFFLGTALLWISKLKAGLPNLLPYWFFQVSHVLHDRRLLESCQTISILYNQDGWYIGCMGLSLQTKYSNTQFTGES